MFTDDRVRVKISIILNSFVVSSVFYFIVVEMWNLVRRLASVFLKRDLFQVTLTKGIIFIQGEFIYFVCFYGCILFLISLNLPTHLKRNN